MSEKSALDLPELQSCPLPEEYESVAGQQDSSSSNEQQVEKKRKVVSRKRKRATPAVSKKDRGQDVYAMVKSLRRLLYGKKAMEARTYHSLCDAMIHAYDRAPQSSLISTMSMDELLKFINNVHVLVQNNHSNFGEWAESE